jgi:NTP pyrophosphatase (non-canonical NTP hydrolase)
VSFDEYQLRARTTAVYKHEHRVTYPLIALAGEVGELCNKYKKVLRGDVTLADSGAIVGELGDVLWYFAALCSDLGVEMSRVAELNLEKLASRRARGTIHGTGDER